MSISITSTVFASGQRIPREHTGDGADISPPLDWHGLPIGTRQLALICDDPDAPTVEPWVHWVIYMLPGDLNGLPAAVPSIPALNDPPGALQGRNSWSSGRTIGYRGPAPPPGHGVHHYHFRLYAIGTDLVLKPGLDKTSLLKAIDGHMLSHGDLVGTYER